MLASKLEWDGQVNVELICPVSPFSLRRIYFAVANSTDISLISVVALHWTEGKELPLPSLYFRYALLLWTEWCRLKWLLYAFRQYLFLIYQEILQDHCDETTLPPTPCYNTYFHEYCFYLVFTESIVLTENKALAFFVPLEYRRCRHFCPQLLSCVSPLQVHYRATCSPSVKEENQDLHRHK